MAISGNYTVPVTVNGFSCRNCSDVDRAKKNIDPADPSGGPFGANRSDSDLRAKSQDSIFDTKKVDETLAALQASAEQNKPQSNNTTPYGAANAAPPTGQLVNLFA